jgi:hypothetical protein
MADLTVRMRTADDLATLGDLEGGAAAGPPGPAGPAGSTGPAGPQGPAGVTPDQLADLIGRVEALEAAGGSEAAGAARKTPAAKK